MNENKDIALSEEVFTTKDGGAAFPQQWTVFDADNNAIDEGEQNGMTLRQWYAGQALAMLADNRMDDIGSDLVSKAIAAAAYKIADTMIAEGSKQ